LAQTKDQDTNFICVNPHISAEFPGGMKALVTYLNINVINNIYLTEDEINRQRVAYAKILISESGKVDSVSIIRGSHVSRLDTLFLNVLKKMPDWKPGELNGKKTKQWFSIPLRIEFR
jgi:hypothetical protein